MEKATIFLFLPKFFITKWIKEKDVATFHQLAVFLQARCFFKLSGFKTDNKSQTEK